MGDGQCDLMDFLDNENISELLSTSVENQDLYLNDDNFLEILHEDRLCDILNIPEYDSNITEDFFTEEQSSGNDTDKSAMYTENNIDALKHRLQKNMIPRNGPI